MSVCPITLEEQWPLVEGDKDKMRLSPKGPSAY